MQAATDLTVDQRLILNSIDKNIEVYGLSDDECFELQNQLIDLRLVEVGFMTPEGDFATLVPTQLGRKILAEAGL